MAPKAASKASKADTDPLIFDSRHPRLAVMLHPGTQAAGYPGRKQAPFELCLLSSDGDRFAVLEAFDEAARGGSVLYRQEKGSRPVSDLPGRKLTVLDVDPMFGARGSMMFELTDRRREKINGYTASANTPLAAVNK